MTKAIIYRNNEFTHFVQSNTMHVYMRQLLDDVYRYKYTQVFIEQLHVVNYVKTKDQKC